MTTVSSLLSTSMPTTMPIPMPIPMPIIPPTTTSSLSGMPPPLTTTTMMMMMIGTPISNVPMPIIIPTMMAMAMAMAMAIAMPTTSSSATEVATTTTRRRRRRTRRTCSISSEVATASSMNRSFSNTSTTTATSPSILNLMRIRGGGDGYTQLTTTMFFETLLTVLVTITTFIWCYCSKLLPSLLPLLLLRLPSLPILTVERTTSTSSSSSTSSAAMASSTLPARKSEEEAEISTNDHIRQLRRHLRSLQIKYWTVFWLMRCAYWMSGPYIVPIYRQKLLQQPRQQLPSSSSLLHDAATVVGVQNQITMIFVCGFVVQILFGPIMGQMTDFIFGRKFATILYGVLLAFGMTTLKYNSFGKNNGSNKMFVVLLLGRALMGCAQSLLPTAPESWLNTEVQQQFTNMNNNSNNNNTTNVVATTGTAESESSSSSSRSDGGKSESRSRSKEEKEEFVGKTIGTAYTGDAFVAILAGKLASWAASSSSTSRVSSSASSSSAGASSTAFVQGGKNLNAPFDLATIIVVVGCIATSFLWNENTALSTPETSSQTSTSSSPSLSSSSMKDAFRLIRNDPKLLLLCTVQALVGSATNLFILHWTTVISQSVVAVAVGRVMSSGGGGVGSAATSSTIATVPYGTIFSCFMTCSLLGSMIFGSIMKIKTKTEIKNDSKAEMDQKSKNCSSSPATTSSSSTVETLCSIMLFVATICMSTTAWLAGSVSSSNAKSSPTSIFSGYRGRWVHLVGLTSSMCLYEGCVGMYYPMTGMLRNKLIPSSHKSLIASLFGIPLNVLVIGTYLLSAAAAGSRGSSGRSASAGSFGVASILLSIATVCMIRLRSITRSSSSTSTAVIIDI